MQSVRHKIDNLEEMLDRMEEGARGLKRVSFGAVVEATGQRSFAPLLLLVGLVAASPISAIPGVPTTVAILVFLIAVQMILRRRHFWLPRWLLERTVSRNHFDKALEFCRKPARFIDAHLLHHRLTLLTRNKGAMTTAIVCLAVSFVMPPMELVPFSTHIAGLALCSFALALLAGDGLLMLVALATTATALMLVAKALL